MERTKNLADGVGPLVALVAVPIGNSQDLSPRAKDILAKADLVCCEDTRTTGELLKGFGIKPKKMVSLYSQVEGKKSQQIIQSIKGTETLVAYCSDAGTPGISDPGALFAKECIDNNIRVTSIPGCCAAIDALAISGLDTADFVFYGFLSTKADARDRMLESARKQPMTMVFYEAPSRVVETLKAMDKILGNRPFALLRELTKDHEEAIRGTLDEALDLDPSTIRGECVICVDGYKGDPKAEAKEVESLYSLYADNGISPSLSAKLISKQLGLKKNEVYRIIQGMAKDQESD